METTCIYDHVVFDASTTGDFELYHLRDPEDISMIEVMGVSLKSTSAALPYTSLIKMRYSSSSFSTGNADSNTAYIPVISRIEGANNHVKDYSKGQVPYVLFRRFSKYTNGNMRLPKVQIVKDDDSNLGSYEYLFLNLKVYRNKHHGMSRQEEINLPVTGRTRIMYNQ